MSEGTRKSGQKEKKEEEEQNIEEDEEGGREGIYIIVVEELSKELLATCHARCTSRTACFCLDCCYLFIEHKNRMKMVIYHIISN